MMNFADGPQEAVVGMSVAYSNGQGGRHYHLNESKIEKVGNKLVTLENGDKFFIENGQKQSQYTSGRLYSSREAYDKSMKESKVIHQVENALRGYMVRMNYQQAIKVAEILNIKLENV